LEMTFLVQLLRPWFGNLGQSVGDLEKRKYANQPVPGRVFIADSSRSLTKGNCANPSERFCASDIQAKVMMNLIIWSMAEPLIDRVRAK